MTARSRRIGRSAGAGIALKGALVALAFAAAAGCVDLDLAVDTVFPATIPGLPTDASWVDLPVRTWVVDGGIRAQAIAACFASTCAAPAAVGLFTATGPAADRLAALVARPGEIRLGMDRRRHGGKASSRVAIAPVRFAGMSGAAIDLARADGTRPAYGIVLGRRHAGTETVVIVISPRHDVASRLAQDVAAALE